MKLESRHLEFLFGLTRQVSVAHMTEFSIHREQLCKILIFFMLQKITNNRLGSEGAKLLCSVVAHNPTIESLDLSGKLHCLCALLYTSILIRGIKQRS